LENLPGKGKLGGGICNSNWMGKRGAPRGLYQESRRKPMHATLTRDVAKKKGDGERTLPPEGLKKILLTIEEGEKPGVPDWQAS